jgi:Fe-S-cluster-containing dehydrogenase component
MSWTRREFLMAAGAAARPLCCEASEAFSGNPDRFGVLTDSTLCIGRNCRRCEIACARENGLLPIVPVCTNCHEADYTFPAKMPGSREVFAR